MGVRQSGPSFLTEFTLGETGVATSRASGGGFRSARSFSLSTAPENIQSSTASSNRINWHAVVHWLDYAVGRCRHDGEGALPPTRLELPGLIEASEEEKAAIWACGTRSACGHLSRRPIRRSRLPARRSAASARRHDTPVSLPGSPLDR